MSMPEQRAGLAIDGDTLTVKYLWFKRGYAIGYRYSFTIQTDGMGKTEDICLNEDEERTYDKNFDR